jgi:hypothetical protein
MEDTTMTDPTPTRWTVDGDGNPSWRHANRDWNLTRHDLAYTLWTAIYPERAADEAHAALVQCVRDADRLRQARELADQAVREWSESPSETYDDTVSALLDLLVDGGTDG